MTFTYLPLEDAIARDGLRMVVVSGGPSPWGEAAKGILHVKGLDWVAVRLDATDEALTNWTGVKSAPALMYNDARPRSNWADILLLAEQLAPAPALLPSDPSERALVMGYAHEICGEGGLGRARRLALVHAGLQGEGGFDRRRGAYLAEKYGYSEETGAAAQGRVADLLGMLAAQLKTQRAAGRAYYFGENLTAVDIYSAMTMALFRPLPPELCDMREPLRAAFDTRDPKTDAALDPILIEHRDWIYDRHLVLPLSL
jgi:glutathione S-transferase